MGLRASLKKMECGNVLVGALGKFYRRHRKTVSGTDISLANQSREEVFSDIYKNKKWGGGETDFYSGGGSHIEGLVFPYVKKVNEFIEEHSIHSVCDFGCGDFNIGLKITREDVNYFGLDIVPELVKRNNQRFGNEHIKFIQADIVEDDGPDAELALVREVLQHLSNGETIQVIEKMKKYKYVIVTESVTREELLGENYNLNVAHGNSFGKYLNKPPFNMEVTEILKLDYPGEATNQMLSVLICN